LDAEHGRLAPLANTSAHDEEELILGGGCVTRPPVCGDGVLSLDPADGGLDMAVGLRGNGGVLGGL